MQKILGILLALCASTAFGQLTYPQREESTYPQAMYNGGFEHGATGWSVSAGSIDLATAPPSGTNVYNGYRAGNWSPTAAGDTLTSPTVTMASTIGVIQGQCVATFHYKPGGAAMTVAVQSGATVIRSGIFGSLTSGSYHAGRIMYPCARTLTPKLVFTAGDNSSVFIDQVNIRAADPYEDDNLMRAGQSFDAGMIGWERYADAAGSTPVDGTGGSPTSTVTLASAANAMNGATSAVFNHPASNRQGEGLSWAPYTTNADQFLDPSYTSATLSVDFDYKTSANYISGDMIVYVIDGNTITSIGSLTASTTATRFHGTFTYAGAPTTNIFRLALHVATTSTLSYTVTFDDVHLTERPFASATRDGYVSTAAQTFAGVKRMDSPKFNEDVSMTTTSTKLNYLTSAIGTTGTASQKIVFDTSPVLVTPTLGVASATSINKVAITAPASGSTLTVADGKTLTANNTVTFTGTDGSSVALGGGGNVAYNPTTTTGDLIYASNTAAPATLSRLGIGTDGYVLTPASGVPTWGQSVTSGFTVTSSGSTTTLAVTSTHGSSGNTQLNLTSVGSSVDLNFTRTGGSPGTASINGGANILSFKTNSVERARFNTSGGMVFANTSGTLLAGFFVTSSASSATACNTTCSSDASTYGMTTNSGTCVAAWNSGTNAVITCGDTTGSVARKCLCAALN